MVLKLNNFSFSDLHYTIVEPFFGGFKNSKQGINVLNF